MKKQFSKGPYFQQIPSSTRIDLVYEEKNAERFKFWCSILR